MIFLVYKICDRLNLIGIKRMGIKESTSTDPLCESKNWDDQSTRTTSRIETSRGHSRLIQNNIVLKLNITIQGICRVNDSQ